MTHLFQLERFDLSELVQLQATRATPSLIALQNRRQHTGHIGLSSGTITYARTGDEEGKDALFTIFSWEIPSLLGLSLKRPPVENIDAPLEQLLLEAYWRGEELRLMRAMQDTLNVPRDAFLKLLMKTIPATLPGSASRAVGEEAPVAPSPPAEAATTTGLPRLTLPGLNARAVDTDARRARHQERLLRLDQIVRELYERSDAVDVGPIPLAPRPALTQLDEPTVPLVVPAAQSGQPDPAEALPFQPVPCLRLDALESMYGELSELQEVSELRALRFDEP